METKTKPFDCVEMKRAAQQALLCEFEARRAEFPTLAEFLEAKAKESNWVTAVWDKFAPRQP